MADEQWFYAEGESQAGPVTLAALREKLRAGEVPPTALVWGEGMADWSPARDVPQLADAATSFAIAADAQVGGAPDGWAQPSYPQPQQPWPSAGGGGGDGGPIGYETQGGYAQPAGYVPQVGYYNPNLVAGTQLVYVGFWWRLLAYVIDYIVLFIPSKAMEKGFEGYIESAATSPRPNRPGQVPWEMISVIGTYFVLSIVLQWLYNALMESSHLQGSLGKMAIGAKVTDERGRRVSFARASGRHFGKILSGLLLCVGYIMIGMSQRKQGLHDMMAKTLVVKK